MTDNSTPKIAATPLPVLLHDVWLFRVDRRAAGQAVKVVQQQRRLRQGDSAVGRDARRRLPRRRLHPRVLRNGRPNHLQSSADTVIGGPRMLDLSRYRRRFDAHVLCNGRRMT